MMKTIFYPEIRLTFGALRMFTCPEQKTWQPLVMEALMQETWGDTIMFHQLVDGDVAG